MSQYFDDASTEPNDDEYFELYHQYMGHWGENNCYDGSPPKISDAEKEQLKQYWQREKDYDELDVTLGRITQSKLDALIGFIDQTPPIQYAEFAEFKWQWRIVSNSNSQNGTRDKVRIGLLDTRSKKYLLIGFETWQEFNAHLHITDKLEAKNVFEQIQANVVAASQEVGDYKIGFWVAKEETTTHPGVWAISIDNLICPGRDIALWANDKLHIIENLKLAKTNTINLRGK